MDDLKKIVAKNIISLRVGSHMTQFELGEKINYSDKAVSRWERSEAVPDAYVLLKLSEIFNVSVDYLLKDHSDESDKSFKESKSDNNHRIITLISFIGVWTAALLIFIILFLFGRTTWLIFAYTLPVSLIVLLVFNSIWGNGKNNLYIISAFNWSIITAIYLTFLRYNWWILFLLGIPAQIITFLCFRIHKSEQ